MIKPIERFDRTERIVHWSTAIIMVELIVTGAILYIPDLALLVGHRGIVENVHVYSGIALVLPVVAGIAGPWRAGLLADLQRFDRWSSVDWDYFRSGRKKSHAPLGKFNGGQKAEAALVGGGGIVMLATGLLMRFGPLSWNTWQQGATLVHDIGFFALAILIFAHVAMAVNRPDQLKSMYNGRIPRAWAAKHAPAWLAEVDAEGGPVTRYSHGHGELGGRH
ncbi:MAG: cytochrome b/b6 domain-containing protein [Acidimicrobiales bacterium]